MWEFPSFRPKKDPEVLTFPIGLLLSVTYVKAKKNNRKKSLKKERKKKKSCLID